MLARCRGLERVAVVAGRHHERLDGSGFPAGLIGDLDQVSGLLSCAVLFDELRTAGTSDIATELAHLVSIGTVRGSDVRAVLGGVGVVAAPVARPAGLTEREIEVLGLPARGGTNREIAEQLGVPSRTVGARLEHDSPTSMNAATRRRCRSRSMRWRRARYRFTSRSHR